MSQVALSSTEATAPTWATDVRVLAPIGRALFAAIFIMSGLNHFSPVMAEIAAKQGVPLATVAVPLSGVMAFAGGLSILLGYRARLGAALLVAFLVPVTLAMHGFWSVADPMMRQMHMAHFMKNAGLTGAALLIAYFGAGPMSFDARRARS